ncbi:hypothetical protein [Chitinophaga sp. 22620]|uniref:hypothetical protein n=1 Tax=Chitinophaga sp. 22620 TaxID=3453952 RepID=UPI003F86B6C2
MFRVLLITFGFFYMTSCLNAQVKDHTSVSQKDSITPYKPAAMYKGDINELANALEKKYDEKKNQPSGDSVLVFKAFVDQQPLNDLQHIELIEGTRSAFSDFILQGLRDSGKAWKPMLQGGRAVKSYIRVSARLSSDGSITMSTSNDI